MKDQWHNTGPAQFVTKSFVIYTAWPKKKSRHLGLTKQIGTNLLLDNYCTGDYLSAGKKLFNPTGSMSLFLFLRQPC